MGAGMLRRRLRSALFIDFENVGHRGLADTIPNWISWIEQGEFDEDRRKRRLLVKRVYWNSAAEQYKDRFKKGGFVPVLCEKFAGLKNGADISMALDIMDTARTQPRIREFILVTKDSDFIPVIRRLTEQAKQTAVLVDENNPRVHTTYRQHADIVIPIRKFREATTFQPPQPRRLLRRAVARLGAEVNDAWWAWSKSRRERARARKEAKAASERFDLAVLHAIRATQGNPGQPTARRRIERELAKIPGFTTSGPDAYLGSGSYRALMEEVAKRTDRIKVVGDASGGISVSYTPRDEE